MTDSEIKPGKQVIFKNRLCTVSSDGFRFGNHSELLYYINDQRTHRFMGCASAEELTEPQEAK